MGVLVLPLAAIMAVFAIFCFRLAGTRLDLNATASAAARAASMARSPQAAVDAATQAAHANLADHHRTCNPLQVDVDVDTSNFHRGGQVAVTITCHMSTAGLTGLGLPGTLTGSATAHAIIDTHRVLFGSGIPKCHPAGTEASAVCRERIDMLRFANRAVCRKRAEVAAMGWSRPTAQRPVARVGVQ
jgi:hypothetical protein